VQSPRDLDDVENNRDWFVPLQGRPTSATVPNPPPNKLDWDKDGNPATPPVSLLLCNVHYHDPAEHTTKECRPSRNFVEIHYVYAGNGTGGLDGLLDFEECRPPFYVVAVLAQRGGAQPALTPDNQTAPPAGRHAYEYMGSTTGTSNGATAAFWHVKKECYSVDDANLPREKHETRDPQTGVPRATIVHTTGP
jgi:hypothetical protein